MSFILGLTGSIGMGKSTTASFFRDAGVPVWDADATVHDLYAQGGAAVAPLSAVFPQALVDGAIDRSVFRALIAQDPTALKRIEAIVHPLVAQSRHAFIAQNAHHPLIVLDVPLLFENGSEALCDATLVVSAPPEIQRARVLQRPGMTPDHLDTILAKQMPDAEKRARATYVIETLTPDQTRTQVLALIDTLTKAP